MGPLKQYASPGVYEQFKASHGVWIVHLPQGKVVAVKPICTHLGCTLEWHGYQDKSTCPCHGSEFDMAGMNIKGPAARPLERYHVSLDGNAVIVDKSRIYRHERGQWSDAGAFVSVAAD